MRRTFTDQVFAQVGVQTGDGRLITEQALSFPAGAQPLRWAAEDWGMHLGAVTLPGAITGWRVDAPNVLASGWLDDELPGGAEIGRMIGEGVPLGVSLDLDDVVVEIVDTLFDQHGEPLDDSGLAARRQGFARFAAYNFRLGSSPLRAHARPNAITAAAGDPDVEDGDIWFTFSIDEILERLVGGRSRGATIVDMPAFDLAQMGLDAAGAAPAADDAAADDTAEVAEPEPEAVAASARPIRVRPVHVPRGETPADPALVADLASTLLASSLAPSNPPAGWFTMPEPNQRTPLHVGDDGQVYGHVWQSSSCHTSSPAGGCVLAPTSSPGLPWFHTGYTVTAEGERLPTGVLTIGGGHADEALGIVPAREHYDDTATAWADVVITPGRFGGWACGAARPGLSANQLRAIRGSVPSGDWRGSGGGSELIAVHQVNHPGYPTARFDRGGRPLAIVAAGAWTPDTAAGVTTAHEFGRLAAEVQELTRQIAAPVRARLRAAGTARARQRLRR